MNASFSKRFVGFVAMMALSLACLLGGAGSTAAQMPQPNLGQMSKEIEAQEWLEVLRYANKGEFPRLSINFKVLAPHTATYNCIAHTLGLNTQWVNPMTGPANAPLAKMDALYAAFGYKRQEGLNMALEAGKQKVVVYATLNRDATIHEVTHAAIQQRDGNWTSKLGQLPLIQHPTPESLRGPVYGTPVAVYVR